LSEDHRRTDVLIVDGLRTPRAAVRGGTGVLATVPPTQLLVTLLAALQRRIGFDPNWVEHAVVGCVTQLGEQGGNIACRAVLATGWSSAITAETLNRFCASGLAAVSSLAAGIRGGEVNIGVAGGVESMSRVAMGSDRSPPAAGLDDEPVPTGVAADVLAAANGVTRDELDQYAVTTQSRAALASGNGYLPRSLVTITGPDGSVLIDHDNAIRPGTSRDTLAALAPAFAAAHGPQVLRRARLRWPQLRDAPPVHTAGTSPAMADGAGMLLLASRAAADRHGLAARARIVATASAAVDSVAGPAAAIEAARAALARAGLSSGQLDLVECHEAFAVTPILLARELALPPGRLNVSGGTIALGHPMGACGAILTITLLDELDRRGGRYGLVAVSGAAGMGAAAVLERI